MANNGNKPDFDDLKARLGLKPIGKPGGAPGGPPRGVAGPPGAPGGPGASAPVPQAPNPTQAPQPAAPVAQTPRPAPGGLGGLGGLSLGAAPNVGPNAKPAPAPEPVTPEPVAPEPVVQHRGPTKPPAQVGPPSGLKPQRSKEPAFNPAALPVSHVEVDESVAKKSVFSPAMIGLAVGMLVLGVAGGYMVSSVSNAHQLQSAQENAGARAYTSLVPSVEASKKAVAMIGAIAQDPTTVNYEIPTKMAELAIVPKNPQINGFLGSSNIQNINLYMAKAGALRQLIKQHERMTNVVDKEELKKLEEDNKVIQGNKKFAVMYNHKALLNHLKSKAKKGEKVSSGAADKGYKPPAGRLVLLDEWKTDDEGTVEFTSLSSNQKNRRSVLDVVPIDASEILKTGGQNALQRYMKRVKTLQYYAQDLQTKGMADLLGPIKELAERGGEKVNAAAATATPAAAPAAKEEAAE